MTSASLELQKAVFAALTGSSALTGLLGGSRIYNDVPRGAALPYVTIGESTVRDWSTGSDEGHEHLLTVSVWSRVNGEREVHQISSAVESALNDGALTVAGVRHCRRSHSADPRTADRARYHKRCRASARKRCRGYRAGYRRIRRHAHDALRPRARYGAAHSSRDECKALALIIHAGFSRVV